MKVAGLGFSLAALGLAAGVCRCGQAFVSHPAAARSSSSRSRSSRSSSSRSGGHRCRSSPQMSMAMAPCVSGFVGRVVSFAPASKQRACGGSRRRRDGGTAGSRGGGMSMFFGPQESFFGVGGPELAVVLAVGYFALGPTDLYRLVKDVGKLFGQFKDFGLGSAKSLTDVLEKQLEQADLAKGFEGITRSLDEEWGNVKSSYQSSPGDGNKGKEEEEEEDEYEDIIIEDDQFRLENPAKVDEDEGLFSSLRESADQLKSAFTRDEGVDKKEKGGDTSGVGAPSASKFSQQMSGSWNEDVLADPEESQGAAAAADWAANNPNAGVAAAAAPREGAELANDVPLELTMDEQFSRLEKVAALEDERAQLMQRIDEKFETKLREVRTELLQIVDEDYQVRRDRVEAEVQAEIAAKRQEKGQ